MAVRARILPWRIGGHDAVAQRFAGRGLEVGGPSAAFGTRGLIAIYPSVRRLDNVNFGAETMWEGSLTDGAPYRVEGRETGRQFIREATALTGIPDGTYDFVVSSHTLEHLANPLLGLRQWHRVTRPGGMLAVVVPEGAKTFDRLRPTTPFEHLASDYDGNVGEDDDSHIEEARRLHDHSRDEAILPSDVHTRPNIETRAAHHHVFDMSLLIRAVEYAGYRVISSHQVWPYHLVVIAQAVGATAPEPQTMASVV